MNNRFEYWTTVKNSEQQKWHKHGGEERERNNQQEVNERRKESYEDIEDKLSPAHNYSYFFTWYRIICVN